jgi:3-deoxy-D-manno-octulosonic-acid transferase
MIYILLRVYSFFIYITTPLFILRLKLKSRTNKAYGKRILERFGFYNKEMFKTKHDIWLHAVSFGEVEVARLLIKHYLLDGKRICVTTTTPTGSEHLIKIFGEQITHVYVPYEWPGAITRFLKQIQPNILVIIETELWPNLINICYKNKLPIIITNARLSQRSCNGYSYIKPLMKYLMSLLSLVNAQSKVDGKRFVELGLPVDRLYVSGNLKFDAPIIEPSSDVINNLKHKLFLNRQIIMAASTHIGEDELILKSFTDLKKIYPELVLIIAPRHPERAQEISKLVKQYGFSFVRRRQNKNLILTDDVFLLDTLGELQLFYHVSTVAFVGGSLVEHGGHNVLEPLRAKVPAIVGPHMFNFAFITKELLKINGLLQVSTNKELTKVILDLLNNKELQMALIKAGENFINQHQGALKKNIEIVNQYFKE